MSDVRTQLERLADHVRPNADAFDRLERRRRRRVRNRRVGAIALALAIAIGGTTGAVVAFHGGSGGQVAGATGSSVFAPIWPDPTAADAQAAQDAFASDPSSLPMWRTDAAQTAVEFAKTALGWDDALTPTAASVDGDLDHVTVTTPPLPCPSPMAGSPASWCGGKEVVVDVQRLATGGPWWVVGVEGQWITDVSFQTDANGDATAFRFGATLPDGVTYENALVGVGPCRGWEVDSRGEPMLLRGGSLPLLPSRFPDGCDAVFVAVALAADPSNGVALPSDVPDGLGEQVLFGGSSPRIAILDAFAEPMHLPAAGTANTPAGSALHVNCDGDIALDASSVDAQRDGAHVTIVDGILDQDVTVTVNAIGASDPVRPPETISAQGVVHEVWAFAPGTYEVTCAYPDGPGGSAHHATASFAIADPNNLYHAPELGCSNGYGSATASAGGPPVGERGEPTNIVHEHLSGLTTADALTRLGYPDQLDPVVGVVRDGTVVGTVSFAAADGGWVFTQLEGCDGTRFSWDASAQGGATGPIGASPSPTVGVERSGFVGVLCDSNNAEVSADLHVDVVRLPDGPGPCVTALRLLAPADTTLHILLTNEDAGVPRNLAIYAMTPCLENELGGDAIGCDPGAPLFRGDPIDGVNPVETVYDVPALTAGRYWIQDDLHPDQIHGVLKVAPAGASLSPTPSPS